MQILHQQSSGDNIGMQLCVLYVQMISCSTIYTYNLWKYNGNSSNNWYYYCYHYCIFYRLCVYIILSTWSLLTLWHFLTYRKYLLSPFRTLLPTNHCCMGGFPGCRTGGSPESLLGLSSRRLSTGGSRPYQPSPQGTECELWYEYCSTFGDLQCTTCMCSIKSNYSWKKGQNTVKWVYFAWLFFSGHYTWDTWQARASVQ